MIQTPKIDIKGQLYERLHKKCDLLMSLTVAHSVSPWPFSLSVRVRARVKVGGGGIYRPSYQKRKCHFLSVYSNASVLHEINLYIRLLGKTANWKTSMLRPYNISKAFRFHYINIPNLNRTTNYINLSIFTYMSMIHI